MATIDIVMRRTPPKIGRKALMPGVRITRHALNRGYIEDDKRLMKKTLGALKQLTKSSAPPKRQTRTVTDKSKRDKKGRFVKS